MKKPNIVFVFGDQWRAQATGFGGNRQVRTPNLDALARQSVHLPYAVSGAPVCSPYRGSLLTGRYPLSHGVFVNDVLLDPGEESLGVCFRRAGYDTAYIGKWHLDNCGRATYIPPGRRQGFDYFDVLNCTHDYNRSRYYHGDDPTVRLWDGYDAFAQTDAAVNWIENHAGDKPFLMVLSWGPPHSPYHTAPEAFRALYDPAAIELRPNVPPEWHEKARNILAGYYAHCSALDSCIPKLLDVLDRKGIADDTIFVFTSDHGDMLGSQGRVDKMCPWDESIRVPFLIRWPAGLGKRGRTCDALLDAPDIMPTLLGLCGLPIPGRVEGLDFSDYLRGGAKPAGYDDSAQLSCVQPFATWNRTKYGGREYRGLRTHRYTYTRSLDGPWLLYDNDADPYQLNNLINDPAHAAVVKDLDARLSARLAARGDEFLPGHVYMERFGYEMDASGAVPYRD